MFTFYKKHNNQLYNKLTELSRNKFFYEKIKLADKFETRILLIFFHLAIILKICKKSDLKKKSQEILYNIDQDNTEAELGKNLLKKYFFTKSNNENEKIVNLLEYFKKFRNFCFDLDINIMLNGSIDFNYR